MEKIISKLWAKKKEENGQFKWLSLTQHLWDTQNIIVYLWDHWLSEAQRQIVIQSLAVPAPEIARNLARFLGAIHDNGKATPVFQVKKGYNHSPDLDAALIEKLELAGFTGISTLQLASPNESHHALAGERIIRQLGVKEDIASIIGAHHGKPVEHEERIAREVAFPRNYFQADSVDHPTAQKWLKAQEVILEWALNISDFKDVSALPEVSQAGQVILTGLLITADWIASNEQYFPLKSLTDEDIDWSNHRSQTAWKKWFKTYPIDLSNKTKDIYQSFENRFEFSPRNVQTEVLEIVDSVDEPGLFILEAPMGLGKTETALMGAEVLMDKTQRSGIFFGLPTQATSNGIFPRIEKWLTRLSEENKESVQIRLSHGKASLNESFAGLARNIDDDGEGQVFVNEWFAGRKTAALDDFVVGTVDQCLMLALKQKHLMLRHLGFSKKVVILDEVHAYDAYTNQYLSQALKWLAYYDVPVIVLSATLPAQTRVQLVDAYLWGKGSYLSKASKKQIQGDSYPLLTYIDGVKVEQFEAFEEIEDKRVQVKSLSDDQLDATLQSLLHLGAVVGVVVNTVKKAQELAADCVRQFGQDKVCLLHSSFIATDRAKLEADLIEMIGKDGQRPKGQIIIGTQVLEQSLDIDFDVLITDLAPMDLLIQRIGRLHRHLIPRPNGLEKPVTYVLGMGDSFDFDKGSSAVYGEYLLMRTQCLLPESINIPSDISPLVQQVYSDNDEITLDKDLEEKYLQAKQCFETELKIKKSKANTYLLSDPQFEDLHVGQQSLIGWLKGPSQDVSDEKSYAQVRDIQESIEIIAVRKLFEGYTFFGEDIDISHQIEEFTVGKRLANETIKLPMALTQRWNIDTTIEELEIYNKKYLANWQDQAWLRGKLGLIFDEEGECTLNGYRLKYDAFYGLMYEREEQSESI
ncbi:CRISPR-associated helicase/endonuclease Cas3 [Suicoccus acidiformans]|uniref:CRISPR-associated helicase/endonuclease Cas3 n=1 Tax=Suicoccus acidiformans TaxID=2036206 RepID=A0A347WJP9_9LACT|nr:CRISPR-associated helicase Cas3' [Suicoccus acidiformans]AXY25306.1 CRISPR-associated helicase/endonuclease Cas3 [Suicoccus acidiformans]